MSLLSRWKSLRYDQKGSVLIISSLTMPILIGVVGLATDTIQWTLDKRQLQRSADSAALAGAMALAQDHDAEASANDSVGRTNSLTLTETPVVEWPPTAGGYSGNSNSVRVVLRTRRNLPFSSMFLSQAPLIEVSATAQVISNGNYCVIALEQGTETGVTITGNSTIDLNCGMFANSAAGAAVSAGGSATIRSTPVGAVGGIPASDSYKQPTTLLPYSIPQEDPFAHLEDPDVSGCSPKLTVQPSQTRTISPGCYRGMDLKGTVTLEPGVYYIDGGSLSFGSQAHVTGDGVTFVLTSENADFNPSSVATLDMNGGAEINISAPDSGTYQGVLIFQDRRAQLNTVNRINGNSDSILQGAFYFPRQILEFNGTSGMTTDCIQLVGSRVNFSGNSTISNICPTNGSSAFRGTVVRLVE